jgi:PmbA protein
MGQGRGWRTLSENESEVRLIMLKDILDILKSSSADDWEITDTKTSGWEFYFIKHALDQNRAKEVEHVTVTVYKKSEDGKYLGNASGEIALSETKENVKKTIEDMIFSASLVKNNIYELNEPKQAEPIPAEEGTTASVSEQFIRTMTSLPETKTEDINSYEIFVDHNEKHLMTSKGIDITSNGIASMIEVVVNARNPEHEIELYRMYHSGTCNEAGLKNDLVRTMQYGCDRLKAVPTPALESADVVFSTEDAARIYEYFLAKVSASSVYQKISDWKLNEPAVKNEQGDTVTLKAVRCLKNSSSNAAYDSEGAPIKDTVLIEKNTPKAYWGKKMFASYLGLADSFIVSNWTVDGGSKSEAEIRSGRYLEIVEFSDFQVDHVAGDIFGEIRLAYLHDGDQVTIVTGGSVSGNMSDYAARMWMSKEQTQYNEALIPSLTKLCGVKITGAAKK